MKIGTRIVRKIREGFLKKIVWELKFIYGYGMKYKREVWCYTLFGLLGTAMSLGSGIVSKWLIDAVMTHKAGALVPAAVFYASMQILRIGVNAYTSRLSARVETKVNQEIRADIYDKIMQTDWEAMSQFHSGDLLNRVENDVSSISNSVLGWIPDLATRSLQLLGALCIILYYDPTLAGLALVSSPVTILVSRFLMKKMCRYNKKLREISSGLTSFQEESFQQIQVIKSFNLTGLYGKRFREMQKTYKETKLEYNKVSVWTNSLMALTGSVVSMLCLGWGVYRLWTGHITYGTMTLFLQMASTLQASFAALIHLAPQTIAAATAAGRLMAVTELPKEKRYYDEQMEKFFKSVKQSGATARLKNIEFRYSTGQKVFSHADFVAKPGEIVALVGPSGEGKTTLLRILLGIVMIQRGAATVSDGREHTYPVSAATRGIFAYVPQKNTMFTGTIAQNLRMMKQDADEEELKKVLKMACAYEFVSRIPTGLDSPIYEAGGGFSEGQIQRLSIARALLSDAPILLLDEATSALDAETERQVLQNIIRKEAYRTCIVTTHRPSVLAACDRVYRICNGRIRELDEADIQDIIRER